MQVSSSLDSMQTLIKPLNGNIAISQFQLMECDVDAVRALISEHAYRERVLSYVRPFPSQITMSGRHVSGGSGR